MKWVIGSNVRKGRKEGRKAEGEREEEVKGRG